MINIDFNKLNPLEKKINETLITLSKTATNITITKASEACDCSLSKISKFVKKLGFNNYKQYIDFLYGRGLPENRSSIELERIKNFIDDFDISLVDEFIELLNSYKKIILLVMALRLLLPNILNTNYESIQISLLLLYLMKFLWRVYLMTKVYLLFFLQQVNSNLSNELTTFQKRKIVKFY